VAYFQVPWATKSGALMVFGVEAAQVIILLNTFEEPDGFYRLVFAMFLIAVPMTQLKGSYFRVSALKFLFIWLTAMNLCIEY
jgi:hypothetical protein